MINTVDEVLDFRFIRSSPISTYYETSETKCRLILLDYSCLWSRQYSPTRCPSPPQQLKFQKIWGMQSKKWVWGVYTECYSDLLLREGTLTGTILVPLTKMCNLADKNTQRILDKKGLFSQRQLALRTTGRKGGQMHFFLVFRKQSHL